MSESPTNGTVETATITLPKLTTLDGRGTCGLNFTHDHLRCPLIRTNSFGTKYSCAWTGSDIHSDHPDIDGYLRPCSKCPIHNHE